MISPLSRLLRANISAPQLAGYAAANLVGLVIILVAIQFYRDVSSVYSGADTFMSDDFMVISKPVSLTSSAGFTPAEIAGISAQPWAAGVGRFETARFNVAASVDMGGRGMSSQLFLESIPEEFLDVRPGGWGYTPGEEVPVIVSKDYLTLYNFGFASSHGLPQLSEELIGMVPLRLSLSGNGRQQWVDARIVGFSRRLNTIAVPEEFMTWANSRFSEQPVSDPSRLIIRLDRPGSPEAEKYVSNAGYEVAGDKTASSRAAYFLTLLTGIIIAIGAVISALAFIILVLSIYLLLQKNRARLTDLMSLGYTPRRLAGRYIRLIAVINLAVTCLAILALWGASAEWRDPLSTLGVSPTPLFPTIFISLIIMSLLTLSTSIIISRSIRASFRR